MQGAGMRLFKEICKTEQGKGEKIAPLPRVVLIPGQGGYFEGVQSVGDFSSDRLVVYFSGKSGYFAEVEGKNFEIGKYCDGDLQLLGKISLFHFINPSDIQSQKEG
jgi:hypothetical protein